VRHNRWLQALIILLVFIASVYLLDMLWKLGQRFAGILLLFFLAWTVSFALTPIIEALVAQRVRRVVAVTGVYMVIVLAVLVFAVLAVPAMVQQVNLLAGSIPASSSAIMTAVDRVHSDLVARGVKEIVLVAQDSTAYGRDWGAKDVLPELIDTLLDATPTLDWLRLMYAYPGHVTEQLAETMARQPQVVHYIDVPMQHGAAGVLRRMRRPSPDIARRMIENLRAAMPDIAIRSTFIVGYPAETESEFQELLDFLSFAQLDRVGAFTFSPEPGTPSAEQAGQLPQELKDERFARVMEHQRAISLAKNRALVGRNLDVLIEGVGDGISVGRSYRDAPEVDGVVIVQRELRVGAMVRVDVTGAMEYDLIGQTADGRRQTTAAEYDPLLQIAEPFSS